MQYKTIPDKSGVEQIDAARVQKRIPINLQRIKYLLNLFPLTGFLFLASFPLSTSPLLNLLGNNWLISYLTKLSGDYLNIKYMFCLLGTQNMIFGVKYFLHFHWKKALNILSEFSCLQKQLRCFKCWGCQKAWRFKNSLTKSSFPTPDGKKLL